MRQKSGLAVKLSRWWCRLQDVMRPRHLFGALLALLTLSGILMFEGEGWASRSSPARDACSPLFWRTFLVTPWAPSR